jgi:hypothetical protein
MYLKLGFILENVLYILAYPDNKQAFITNFLQICRQYSVITLINKLPDREKQAVKQQLARVTTGAEGKQILMRYLSKNIYEKTLNEQAEKLFAVYIETILPTLDHATAQKLQSFCLSIKNGQQYTNNNC